MAKQKTLTQYDYGMSITTQLMQEDGKTPYNLSGKAVNALVKLPDGIVKRVPCTVTNTAGGYVVLVITVELTIQVGSYMINYEITDSFSSITASNSDNYFVMASNGAAVDYNVDPYNLDLEVSNAEQIEKINSTVNFLDQIMLKVVYGVKGDGITDDTEAIQAAINYAASNGKKLFFPYGVYLISAPLVLPHGALEWGIEISGVKSETKYQYLPGSRATVIKANAAMPVMITNRGANPDVNVAYYNVVKNIVLDGNNLAEKGYINGWQDKILNCSVIQCTKVGVSFGSLTNLTIMSECTLALNKRGFECVDSDSTIWYLDKCTIRENTFEGAVVSSAVGAVLTSCTFESNQGKALIIKGTAEQLKRVTGLKLANTCYFEGNTDYAIEIENASDVEIEKPWINAISKAVNIVSGSNIKFREPNFVGGPTAAGYFVNNGSDSVIIEGTETALSDVNFSITGAKASSVSKAMVKTTGTTKGRVLTNATKAAILQPNAIVCTNGKTMQVEELCGTVLNNSGQSGVNIGINLPIPTENYRFRVVISDTQAANNFRINTDGQATIFLDGVASPKAWIEIINPKMGDCIEFMAFTGDKYYWLAKPIRGAWSSY